jgi:hypothetical protein
MRNDPYLSQFIDEQRELNKKSIVFQFIGCYLDENGTLPDAENVQEELYPLDLDLALINDQIQYHKEHTKYGAY